MAKTKKRKAKTTTTKTVKKKSTKAKRSDAKKAKEVEVKVDRRRTNRRKKSTKKTTKVDTKIPSDSMAPKETPAPKVERRAKVQRRRQIDPTTCERDYSNDEIEFMHALDDYKRASGRMFPTCSEILEVIRGLGYLKSEPKAKLQDVSQSDEGDTNMSPDLEPQLVDRESDDLSEEPILV